MIHIIPWIPQAIRASSNFQDDTRKPYWMVRTCSHLFFCALAGTLIYGCTGTTNPVRSFEIHHCHTFLPDNPSKRLYPQFYPIFHCHLVLSSISSPLSVSMNLFGRLSRSSDSLLSLRTSLLWVLRAFPAYDVTHISISVCQLFALCSDR